jgi:thioredoxin-related protein
MKKVLFGVFSVVGVALAMYTFSPIKKGEQAPQSAGKAVAIKWMSWQEAVEANKKEKKKIFIDCYTDWCGWCKKMDASTFTDPKVAELMNKHFYAVKFDAEQKENIVFDNHTFKYIASGSRGVHELAYALLDGQLGYPAFVYLDEKFQRVTISPGYKTPEQILPEMKFVGEGHYNGKTYEQYVKGTK